MKENSAGTTNSKKRRQLFSDGVHYCVRAIPSISDMS